MTRLAVAATPPEPQPPCRMLIWPRQAVFGRTYAIATFPTCSKVLRAIEAGVLHPIVGCHWNF